jgi:hypothetical protein
MTRKLNMTILSADPVLGGYRLPLKFQAPPLV